MFECELIIRRYVLELQILGNFLLTSGHDNLWSFANYSLYKYQYLRQLWAGGGLKNQVNSAQTGNLLKDFGK